MQPTIKHDEMTYYNSRMVYDSLSLKREYTNWVKNLITHNEEGVDYVLKKEGRKHFYYMSGRLLLQLIDNKLMYHEGLQTLLPDILKSIDPRLPTPDEPNVSIEYAMSQAQRLLSHASTLEKGWAMPSQLHGGFNKIAMKLGLQYVGDDGTWQPTDIGKQYCRSRVILSEVPKFHYIWNYEKLVEDFNIALVNKEQGIPALKFLDEELQPPTKKTKKVTVELGDDGLPF